MSDIVDWWDCEKHLTPDRTDPCPMCVLDVEIERLRDLIERMAKVIEAAEEIYTAGYWMLPTTEMPVGQQTLLWATLGSALADIGRALDATGEE